MIFAPDNSDEEEQDPDDEDLDFISNDMADGVEESIIVDEAIVDDDSNEIIEHGAVSSPKKRWSARNVLQPPDFHFVDADPDYMSIPEDSGDAYLHISNLDKLISEVIVPESARYSQQKGTSFETNVEEIRAFLSIMIFMDYHKLPTMRDYWSADLDILTRSEACWTFQFSTKTASRQKEPGSLRGSWLSPASLWSQTQSLIPVLREGE